MKLRYGSLYAVYEPKYYYWEVIELFRKLLLTAGLVVVENGSPVQLLLGLFIATVYIVAFTQAQPMEEDIDDMLQLVCSFQLVVTMGMGLAIGWSDIRGEYATEADMAKEATNQAVMGMLLVVMNGIIMVLGVWSAMMCSEKMKNVAMAVVGKFLPNKLLRKAKAPKVATEEEKKKAGDPSDDGTKTVAGPSVSSSTPDTEKEKALLAQVAKLQAKVQAQAAKIAELEKLKRRDTKRMDKDASPHAKQQDLLGELHTEQPSQSAADAAADGKMDRLEQARQRRDAALKAEAATAEPAEVVATT